MRYKKLIEELEYWKTISGKEDPEVVINTIPYSHKIDSVQPVKGIEDERALGILF
mgnify:CR=1 FL=1